MSVGVVGSCHPGPTDYSKEYPGPWRDPTSDVIITLAHNGAHDCGEFYERLAASSSPGAPDYLVACTPDGRQWFGYLVWPSIDKAMGPDPLLVYQAGGPPPQATPPDIRN